MSICRGEFYPAPGSAGRVCICGRSRPAHDPDPREAPDLAEAEQRLDRAARRPTARDLYHGNRFRIGDHR